MLRRRLAWTLAIWPLVVLVTFASPVHGQEGMATISGFVVNGTANAGTPRDVQVLLRVFREGEEPELGSTTVDNSGWFAFEKVALEGVSGYTLTATYLGVGYTVDLLPEDDLESVTLAVYEATSSMDQISLVTDTVLVQGTDATTRTISIWEIALVANVGDRVFLPDLSETMNVLTFSLPPSAANLEVQSRLPEGQFFQIDHGFALATPVPPGEYEVFLVYTVPYDGSSLDLSRSFLMGVGSFRILVPETVGSVSSSTMTVRDNTIIGDVTYQRLEAVDIPPGGSVDVVLQGLSQRPVVQPVQSESDSKTLLWAVAVLLALVLAALLVVGLRRRRSPELVAGGDMGQGRASLVQTIAALEDRFQQGEMEEATYQEQRRALKARLLRLTWEEETGS